MKKRLNLHRPFNNAFFDLLINNFAWRNSRKDKLTEKANELMDRFNRLLKPCLAVAPIEWFQQDHFFHMDD